MVNLAAEPEEVVYGTEGSKTVVLVGGDPNAGGNVKIEPSSGGPSNTHFVSGSINEGVYYGFNFEGSSGGNEYVQLNQCSFSTCYWGTYVDIDNGIVYDPSGNEVGNISGDRIAISGAGSSPPDGWATGTLGELNPQFSKIENLQSNVCQGTDLSFDVTWSNDHALETATVSYQANVQEFDSTYSESVDIPPGSSETRTVTLTIPDTVQGGSDATIEVFITGDGTSKTESLQTRTVSVGVPPNQITIDRIQGVSGGCVGDSVRPEALISNSGDCDASVDVRISNSVNDSTTIEGPTTIRSKESSTESFSVDLPSAPGGTEITYTIDVLRQEQVIATDSATATIGGGDFTITTASGPSAACVGDSAEIVLQATNTGSCESQARFSIKEPGMDSYRNLEADNVRSGSSIDSNIDVVIPAPSGDVTTVPYDVRLQKFNGSTFDTVSEKTINVNVADAELSLNEMTVPSSACAGSEFNTNVSFSNEGQCETRARVQFINGYDGTVQTSTPETLRSGSSVSANFQTTLPNDAAGAGDITFTGVLQTPTESGWRDVTTLEKTLTVGQADINITSFDSPPRACVGNAVELEAEARNDGSCIGIMRLLASNTDTGNSVATEVVDMSQSQTTTGTFELGVPTSVPEDGSTEYVVEAQQQQEGTFTTVDSRTVQMTVESPSFALEVTDSPSAACVGQDFEVRGTIANQGPCSGNVRVVGVESTTGSTQTLEPEVIEANTSKQATINFTLPVGAKNAESATFNIKLQSDLTGAWEDVSTSEVTVSPRTPQLDVTDAPYPDKAKLGEDSTTITLANSGECRTTATLSAGDFTESVTVPSDGTATIDHTFKVGVEPTTFTVTVEDSTLGEVVYNTDVTVEPKQYISLDTIGGELNIVGGGDTDNRYRGVLNGGSIKGADDLEENDRLVVGTTNGFIRGTAGTEPDEVDTVTFGSIQYFNMVVQEPIQWVVDGEIRGESKSLKFSTVFGDALNTTEELPVDEADIQVTGSPLANLGVVRQQVGFDAKYLNGKQIRKFTGF